MGKACRIHEIINTYRPLVRKPEEENPLRRPRHKWENNIKRDFKEVGFEDVDWIHLAQDRVLLWTLVHTMMNHQVS
jgi:hypothetical protein